MLTFIAALSAMGFTGKPIAPSKAATPSATQNHRDVNYYFYDNDDNYTNFATAITEEGRLEGIYGVYVDENSIGGTLLEEGYVMPGEPHTGFPDIFLYGHFLR
jgi:hypothetical protein